ncbi:MAG TPA: FISUMP domain-containing protein, partial [Bacteroidales bacterium]|nr:FISUMP domain-containing protein [Bacteroidales bacterium]
MKRILHIIIITLFVSPCANSQNLSVHFEAHGESSAIDSIHITNITHNTSISIGGNDLLELVFPAQNRLMQQSDKSILVFPNPSSDICYLECKVLYPGEALISVFDITGKTIHQSTRELEKGIHQFSFNNLPAGLYQVSIQSAHYCYHAKMVSNSATHTGFSVDYLGFAPLCEPEQDLIAQKVLHEFVYSFGDILLFRAVSSQGYITINTLKIQASDTTDSIYEFNVDFGFMSCKDVDDKMYSIVKIGDRYWMAENLHSVRYSDSTDIIGIEDAGEWINTQAGAFSNYGNNETNFESFGRLYNWYAATNTRGICPTGWRMPTDDDFKEMERSLGMTHIQTDEVGWRGMAEGCYLKEHTGLTWSQTGDDINLSGFSALPAGMRNFTGSFFYETKNAVWWTASEANSLNAWCRALSNET